MSNQIYFDAMKAKGLADAADLQERSSSLDGTALYAEEDKIPDFAEAVKVRNMLERKAGQKDGFVCRSSAGRVVRLLQVYDSEIYPQEPEELPAQWGFVWSTDPGKALPFLSLSTSPYAKGTAVLQMAKPGAARLTPTPGPRRQARSFGRKWNPDEPSHTERGGLLCPWTSVPLTPGMNAWGCKRLTCWRSL